MGRKIGLALGSGGARGLCSIGVLQWFKDNGVPVSCVTGTSIGAIIGAAFSAGFTPEYLREIATGIGWKDYVKHMRISLGGKSVFEWEKIENILRENFGEKKIEDLKIPFGCVASDIDTGREYIFTTGDLVEALSASACIPGIFPPVEVSGAHLVDGELVNPVPIDLAMELGAGLVVGVNACRSVFTERNQHKSGHFPLVRKVDEWVKDSMEKNPILSSIGSRIRPGTGEVVKKRRRFVIDIFTDSLAIVSSRVLSLERLVAGPHFMIRPQVGGYQDFDFDLAGEIIRTGYAETESIRDELFKFLGIGA